METFSGNNVREPENLSEYNEVEHLEAIKEGKTDIFENEYHLIEKTIGFPKPFMELEELEQRMVLFYIDKEFIEPHSRKGTQGNVFRSFLASYDNEKVLKNLYEVKTKVVGYNRSGDEIIEEYVIPNEQYRVLYQQLKKEAISIWNKSKLKDIVKSMRVIVANGGYKDEELLEEKIIANALSDDRDSFTLGNIKTAVKIKGMEKPSNLNHINVYLTGGGREANRAIVDSSHNSSLELLPDGEE